MAYALLPVGMGAVAAGRLGTALVLVLLPLIAAVAARVFTHGRRRARRAAWAAALLVAVAAAFVPLVWVLTVAAMALGALVFRRGRPGVLIDAAIVAVVPVVLLLPWSIALATHPSQLLLEAGLQPAGLAIAPPARPVPHAAVSRRAGPAPVLGDRRAWSWPRPWRWWPAGAGRSCWPDGRRRCSACSPPPR